MKSLTCLNKRAEGIEDFQRAQTQLNVQPRQQLLVDQLCTPVMKQSCLLAGEL